MLWIKSLHIIFIVCWFAGLFYLPRLMVYHATSTDAATRKTLLVMEGRLYRFTTPFAWLSVGLGLWLAIDQWAYYLSAGWFQAKLALVALLILHHGYCGHLLAELQRGLAPRSDRHYRIVNELPVLILFGVVILVIVRPF